jgi:hypothetical protein
MAATSPYEEFINQLSARGFLPAPLAAFWSGKSPASEKEIAPLDASNIPGFDYMSRVSRVSGIATAAQAELANRAWAEMIAGKFSYEDMLRTYARIVDNYYDVWVEVTRGPGYITRPAWVYFDCVKTKDGWVPETLKAPAKMDRGKTPETELAPTVFEGKGGSFDLYKSYDWVGYDLTLTLDPALVHEVPSGMYMSYVFAKGRSSEAPLAIAVLRVTRDA